MLTKQSFRAVTISAGPNGWGGPLTIQPTPERDKIVAVTGGGIPRLARHIAELTGGTAVDGFTAPPPESEWALVIVDCGGTARCGVYPRKRIPTINLNPVGQVGPLAQFITEDIYVSGVTEAQVQVHAAEGGAGAAAPAAAVAAVAGSGGTSGGPFGSSFGSPAAAAAAMGGRMADAGVQQGGLIGAIANIGRGMGSVVQVLFNSGRRAIDQVIRNVLPFMAFVTMLIGVIVSTGIGDFLAQAMSPLAENIIGLLVLSVICGLPFLSPILGPGAVIAQVIGTAIIGPLIAKGAMSPQMALPALFAYNVQVGCDFVPVGLALGEAKPETIRIGVPAVLISRQIMGPVSVLIAWVFSWAL